MLKCIPVPDGDIGTNMSMTLMLVQQKSKMDSDNIYDIAKNYLKVY